MVSNSSKDENPAPTKAGSSSSAANKTSQFNADAQLLAQFEKSGKLFNYTKSVPHAPQALSSDEKIVAYLSKIQRGSLVQSVGCTLAIEPHAFKIVAYSQNCFDMLGVSNLVGPGLMGSDPRNLFTPLSNTALSEAFAATSSNSSRGLSYLNPIWVHTITNHRSFYAILHLIDVGILIDLEPAQAGDRSVSHAAAKIGVRAASRLQSLPSGGDVGVLCDALVQEVQKLSGFDRVMVYKFHEDEHGEVLAEIRRADLEPYLGLHYPATDIPQAARFLFKQSRVRMICDSNSKPVRVIQSPEIAQQPLCLASSTLRAPHACHVQYMTNMGSIASLVLAILINNNNHSMRLWGLVVCHHTGPRHVPSPLRFACEVLMQVFSLQLQVELQLAVQLAQNRILRRRLLLCDTLLRSRGPPHGIITCSLMDFVKCDGAALYLEGKSSCVGVTPDESQVKDLAEWLTKTYGDRTGLITECLADAGYPGADILGDAVCGMAAERINSSGGFLFWFRSQVAKEIKYHPKAEDDSSSSSLMKMHPRTSSITFLEVVKGRSLPWEAADIDSAHSLQVIMKDWFREGKRCELASVAVDMSRMIESAVSPVFGVDSSGLINGWNAKMCELTGVDASEAHGKSLVNDFVHPDSRGVVQTLITKALQGKEEKNVAVKFVKKASNLFVYLRINTCTSNDWQNDVVGVCFVGQDITAEKTVMDKSIRLEGDYKSIIESANPLIPPIFASDENGRCSEWNAGMENLTGYTRQEMIGKLLADEVFGSICKLKGQDVFIKFAMLLNKAIQGYDPAGKLRFGFYDRRGELVEMHLTANKKMNKSGHVVGCLCFLQTIVVSDENEEFLNENTELAYLRQEVKNPLCGIRLTHQLLEGSSVSDDQKQLLETSGSCERQILSIIEAGTGMELKEEEFLLGSVVNAIVSQAMISVKEKNLRLVHDIPEKIKNMRLCGDEIKLQSALSCFLDCIADYAPSPDGWVEVKVSHGLKLVKDGIEFVHLQFRMVHLGQGLPQDIIEEMFGRKSFGTRRGVGLNISQKIVSAMNGNVCYVRDENEISYFRVDIELKTGGKQDRNNNVLLVES